MVKNFQDEDIIVMTSDGLTNMVDETIIYDTIINDFENADKTLINMANDARWCRQHNSCYNKKLGE